MQSIEDEQADADEQEERELDEDDDAAGEQRQPRFAQVLRGEHALHHQLVGSVRGHGEECAAEHAGPEGVGRGEVEGEVEHVELAGGRGDGVDLRPAAGDVRAERPDGDDGSADVDGHLDDVGPDDGGHSALEGVEQREGGDDGDGEHVAGADGDADDDGDGEDADAFGGGAGEQEEAGGDFVERLAEAAIDELIGGEHLALEVLGQEEHGDDDAAEHVADDDLQEAEVAGEGEAGRADDGERGGFGGDDGEGDGPPGDGAVGEEVAAERFVFGAPRRAKRRPNSVIATR
jgi:hypothetical protein